MPSRVAFSLFLFLCACRGERGTPEAIVVNSASLSSSAATSAATASIAEADYRGTFNGANVYATFETHGTIASGTCFYDADGTEIPLRGAVDERGVVTLQEMDDKGPESAIALERDASGVWFGTWSSEDESRSGSARLEPLVRRAGEPVFVATRRLETMTGGCCDRSARVPVVLGLADRAFEHALNRQLASLADMRPPAGDGATVDYVVPLNERGLVSFEISAKWTGPAARARGAAAGLTAAVDAGEMADDVDDFVDVPKARAATDFLARAHGAVLTDAGVAVLVDGANSGADPGPDPTWRELAFPELGGAMRRGTPFSRAWAR